MIPIWPLHNNKFRVGHQNWFIFSMVRNIQILVAVNTLWGNKIQVSFHDMLSIQMLIATMEYGSDQEVHGHQMQSQQMDTESLSSPIQSICLCQNGACSVQQRILASLSMYYNARHDLWHFHWQGSIDPPWACKGSQVPELLVDLWMYPVHE